MLHNKIILPIQFIRTLLDVKYSPCSANKEEIPFRFAYIFTFLSLKTPAIKFMRRYFIMNGNFRNEYLNMPPLYQ